MDERYLKSTAIVRAYEKRMLDKSGQLRLIESDEAAIARLLDGTFYHNASSDLVAALLKRWRSLVEELIVEEKLRHGLLAFFDFRNVVILAGVANPGEHFYPGNPEIKIEQLRKYIAEKKFSAIYEPLQSYLIKVFSIRRENSSTGEYINYLVSLADYFYYPWLRNLSDNDFWQGYWSRFIDLTNLRYLVRRPEDSSDFQFIPGGFLDTEQLKIGLKQELKQFVQKPFILHDYAQIFDFTAENDYELYRRLEKNIRKFLLDYLRPAKLVPYGLEPVFAFLESFLIDLRNVNFIVRCKEMKIDIEAIKENCDATYI